MDKLKLNIQRFALNTPTAGNLIDEVCLHEYHQNIKRDYAKKGSDNDFANLVVDSIRSKNMFDKDNLISGYRFDTSGNLYPDSPFSASSYIEVKPSTTYTISRTGTDGVACFCLYNSSKTFVSRTFFYSNTTITFTTTSSTYYVRIAEFTTDLGNLMLESGSTATTYAPYQNLNQNIIKLDMMDDTSGSNWQVMMKNKLDYCIANINTTKENVETFINGGWYGVNFGFGIFSKTGSTYQLVWYSTDGIYYCRNVAGTYDYRNILWTNS